MTSKPRELFVNIDKDGPLLRPQPASDRGRPEQAAEAGGPEQSGSQSVIIRERARRRHVAGRCGSAIRPIRDGSLADENDALRIATDGQNPPRRPQGRKQRQSPLRRNSAARSRIALIVLGSFMMGLSRRTSRCGVSPVSHGLAKPHHHSAGYCRRSVRWPTSTIG